jgi:hypothetical protein
LSGIDYEQIQEMDIREINEMARSISFIREPATNKAVNDVIIGKTIYNLQPDVTQMSYGQFKDLSHYTKNKEAINDNLHFIMALFLYEKGTKYDKGFKERAELFRKELTMDVVFPLSAFFFELLKEYVKTTQTYSIQKVQKIVRELKKEIEQETLSEQQKELLTSVSDGSK